MVSMRPCPHCGTSNSAKKRICYQCQQEMQTPETPPAPVEAQPPAKVEAPQSLPVEAPPAAPSRLARPFTQPNPRQRHARLDERAQFYRQLQAMLMAGLTPSLALDSLAQRDNAASLRLIARDLSARTEHGRLLSVAMEQHPETFPEWEVETMHAGEINGKLPEAAGDIAETLEAEWNVRLQVRARTWYLRATANFGLFVLLLVIACHRLADINVAHYGRPVPPDVSAGFRTFVFLLLAAAFVALIINRLLRIIWWRMTVSRRWAPTTQAIIRRLPLLGPIMTNLLRLRFLRVLGSLWDAGVQPIESIEIAARASDDPKLRERIDEELMQFTEGGSLVGVMTATGYFDESMLQMVRTGEQSGSVPTMLGHIVRYLHEDLDARLRSAPMITEMLLFCIVAPLVCYLYAHTMRWYFQMVLSKIELFLRYMTGNGP
ncbi:MAG: type II secretion system F family protein [Armatimonadota bacterium]